METEKNKIMLPVAIVIAGALIAGALYFSRNENSTVVGKQPTTTPQVQDISLDPVTATDHILGNLKAPVVLVEYSDTECPFCQRFHTTMHQIMDTYGKNGKIAWVYRHFPIDQLHPRARKEAEATECANELGRTDAFWKYLDKIYEVTPSNNGLDPTELPKIAKIIGLDQKLFQTCLDSGKYATAIQKSYDGAIKAGGHGTPHSIFVLAKPVGKALQDFVTSMVTELKNAGTPSAAELLYVTKDNRMIVMSGAMQYELVSKLINAILAN